MPSSIRDPAPILFSLLVAIGSTGCGFVLGDIPDNPVFDAGPLEDAKQDGTKLPDVTQSNDGNAGGAGGAPVNDVISTEIATVDTGQMDTTPSDTGPRDTGTADMGPRDTGPSDTMGPRDAPADLAADRSSVDSSVKDATSDPGNPLDPCDMDHDGYRSNTCMGGNDCDDTTDQVYPLEPNFRDMQTHGAAGGGWDYDCNGKPDPEFPTPVNCSLLSLLNCNPEADAFLGSTTPQCGQTGNFGHCVKDTLNLVCKEQIVEPNKIMKCK
jgi:hypothetical protein